MTDALLIDKLLPLFIPKRYKVLYGGRGGGKSHGIARALLIKGVRQPLRILCAREFQSSIRDSVHHLLSEQIHEMGLDYFYEVKQAEIVGRNGTTFGFAGLHHNIMGLKSWEGADVCWCEEAQAISKTSWDVLAPTIRKQGSEIWVSFNPQLDTDETYQRFVVNTPRDCLLININYQDNRFLSETALNEMREAKRRDYHDYEYIWEGKCRSAVEGAIFAREIGRAQEDRRICNVPYAREAPVHTFWDLGWADSTVVWFAQKVGLEYRLLDYLEGSQQPIEYYLKEIQSRPYVYDTHWLPHDARAKTLAGEGRSIEEQIKAHRFKVEIVPMLTKADQINAARTIFNQCWFDKEKCHEGLQALRHYHYEKDEKREVNKKNPVHDWSSHAADGFLMFAVAMPVRPKPSKPKQDVSNYWGFGSNSDHGWMAR